MTKQESYRRIVRRAMEYIKAGADVDEAMERAQRELSKEEIVSESLSCRLRVQD